MKCLSGFSTAFPRLCLSLGLIISVGSARVAAQIPRILAPTNDEWKEKIRNEIEDVKQSIAKNPDDAQEHYRLGGLYEKLFQWQDAVEAYSQAVRIKPDFANAHYVLGWVYAEMNNYEEALKAHQEAEKHIRITSFNLSLNGEIANYAKGWDLYRLRRYDEAIAHYAKAAQIDPSFQEAIYEIGRVHLAQGDQEGVQQIINKLDPYFRDLLLKEMEIIESAGRGGATDSPNPSPLTMDGERRPTILYREKAKYTETARQHKAHGTVVLSVVFDANEKITGVRIIRDLPYCLTAQALIAAQRIKFKPAMKNGEPVSVRGTLEFSFNLY